MRRREISQLQKRVSFRAEWSERSERNAVEESRKLHQGSLVRFLDSATPGTLRQSAGLRSARNDTRFFKLSLYFAILNIARCRECGAQVRKTRVSRFTA